MTVILDNSKSGSERRNFSRIRFDGNTELILGNQRWRTELVDISLKGLLVAIPKDWDLSIAEQLRAQITLAEDAIINMDVIPRHREDGVIGFECEHIDIDSITHLRQLIALNLGDETLLERELAALGKFGK